MGIKTTITIDLNRKIGNINPNIYGHFAEHLGRLVYDGIWVGSDSKISNIDGIRKDIIEALKELKPPVIRWPGGCFADDYHWRDGIGPIQDRPKRVNIHWNSVETNEFGTHEFLRFCELLGAEPYICSNVGSSTPKEMRDWLEYLNYNGNSTLSQLRGENGHPEPYNIHYWGIGNENWGCGGNMSGKYYAFLYKRFASFAHSFNDQDLYKVACGPPEYHYPWTRSFFKNLCENKYIGCPFRLPLVNAFALHHYVLTETYATEFNEVDWYNTLLKTRKMETYIKWHKRIMNFYDRKKTVDLIVDEWGAWHKPEPDTEPKWLYQQNTIRDALVAAMTLDIFNKHADKVAMANIAQTVNVLQAMILTKGEKMILTPTYHVFKIYNSHREGTSLNLKIKTKNRRKVPIISGSCSVKDKTLTLSLINCHVSEPVKININIKKIKNYYEKSWILINSEDIHDHNTFDTPDKVVPKKEDFSLEQLEIPPASVNVLKINIK